METISEYAKIEIKKNSYNKPLFYTGRINDLENGLVKIETEKEEVFIFKKEQIEQVTELNREDRYDESYF